MKHQVLISIYQIYIRTTSESTREEEFFENVKLAEREYKEQDEEVLLAEKPFIY